MISPVLQREGFKLSKAGTSRLFTTPVLFLHMALIWGRAFMSRFHTSLQTPFSLLSIVNIPFVVWVTIYAHGRPYVPRCVSSHSLYRAVSFVRMNVAYNRKHIVKAVTHRCDFRDFFLMSLDFCFILNRVCRDQE